MRDQVFARILNAPINLFYDVTTTSKILQVIRDGFGVFDGELIWNTVFLIGNCIDVFTIAAIITLGSYYFWPPIFFFAAILYKQRRIDRQIKLNVEQTRQDVQTPVHSTFAESLQGNTVIRAFEKSELFKDRQIHLID